MAIKKVSWPEFLRRFLRVQIHPIHDWDRLTEAQQEKRVIDWAKADESSYRQRVADKNRRCKVPKELPKPVTDELVEKLRTKLQGCDALVAFVNMDFNSSSLGNTTAITVGPGCTYKSVADCEGKWLNDLPSQRQYPDYYVEKATQ